MIWQLESKEDRTKRLSQWHDWFAWYPIKTNGGFFAWLSVIKRRKCTLFIETIITDELWSWEYRPKTDLTKRKEQGNEI